MTEPRRRTLVVPAEDGAVQALILQSTQARLGPARIGAMSARTAADPATGRRRARARLHVTLPESTSTHDVTAGDRLDLGPHGLLHVVEVRPQDPGADGPETPSSARGHVGLIWRGEPTAGGAG